MNVLEADLLAHLEAAAEGDERTQDAVPVKAPHTPYKAPRSPANADRGRLAPR